MRASWVAVAIGLAVAACGSAPVAPCPAAPGVTQGVQHRESTVAGKGGLQLRVQTWAPAAGAPTASLVVVHGLKDHSNRYAGLANQLAAKGWAVWALDLRGHGQSPGERVWVEAFDDYVADVAAVADTARSALADKPLFVFGHSMGGAIATLYTLAAKPAPAGLVLSAPALVPGDDVSGFLIWLTRRIAGIAPRSKVLDLPDAKFSRDLKVVAAIACDPLVHHEAGPARTAKELLGAFDDIGARMDQMAVPLLALHGTVDKLTNPKGSQALVQRARSADKTLKLYPGVEHDLLHEPEGAAIAGDIVQWLEARLPGVPTSTAR
ncbi:MAG: lysophospholipase [Deltaproteobacteria bacterium]|nr:lysophospholipase [Deltaproteobacteria bacterium]